MLRSGQSWFSSDSTVLNDRRHLSDEQFEEAVMTVINVVLLGIGLSESQIN